MRPDPPIVNSCCFLSTDDMAAICSTVDRSCRMNCQRGNVIRLPRLHAKDEYATQMQDQINKPIFVVGSLGSGADTEIGYKHSRLFLSNGSGLQKIVPKLNRKLLPSSPAQIVAFTEWVSSKRLDLCRMEKINRKNGVRVIYAIPRYNLKRRSVIEPR